MGDTIITNAPLMFYDSYCIYSTALLDVLLWIPTHAVQYVYKYLYSTYSTVRDKIIYILI